MLSITEQILACDGWANNIPYLELPNDWIIKVIPAGLAMIRFLITTKDKMPNRVSIYLDCHNILGHFPGPYWEVYKVDGGCARFAIDDTQGLLKGIADALEQLPNDDSND